MTDNGENCPRCHKQQMPKIREGEKATARQCQECRYVEEFDTEGRVVFDPALPAAVEVEGR